MCSVNDGETAGLATPTSPFLVTRCTDVGVGGGTDYTLKSNQDSIRCMGEDKKCTVAECCDEPVTCSNNNGDAAGVFSSGFSQALCEQKGGAGYTKK